MLKVPMSDKVVKEGVLLFSAFIPARFIQNGMFIFNICNHFLRSQQIIGFFLVPGSSLNSQTIVTIHSAFTFILISLYALIIRA